MKNSTFWPRYKLVAMVLGALVAVDVVVWIFVAGRVGNHDELALYFLDVGQGDSQLIELLPAQTSGRSEPIQILIDGGPIHGNLVSRLVEVLPPGDRYIDVVLVTHPDLDHFGGFLELMQMFDIGLFVSNGQKGNAADYEELLEILNRRSVPQIVFGAGDAIQFNNSRLNILAPAPAQRLLPDTNDASIVMFFEHGDLEVLYTGDISAAVERQLARAYNFDADILKVSHHGSRFSSDPTFLEAVTPAFAVIGVGKNSYGHPTAPVLEHLTAIGAQVLRTDQNGTVKIVQNGSQIRVFSERIE